MELTQSSKYESLKYNYGGYIPANAVKKTKYKKKADLILTNDEYKKYVINLRCDFLHDIIVKDSIEQQRRSDEKYYHDLLRKELKNHDEKQQMVLFKSKYKKYKFKSHEISKTADGYWNPEVLEYMYALSRQKIIGNIQSGGFDINSKETNKSMVLTKKEENEQKQKNINEFNKKEENKETTENKDVTNNKDSTENNQSNENNKSKENNESNILEDKDISNDVSRNNSSNGSNLSKENNESKGRVQTSKSKSSWDEEEYSDIEDDKSLPPNPCNSYVNSDDELSDTISKYFTLK